MIIQDAKIGMKARIMKLEKSDQISSMKAMVGNTYKIDEISPSNKTVKLDMWWFKVDDLVLVSGKQPECKSQTYEFDPELLDI